MRRFWPKELLSPIRPRGDDPIPRDVPVRPRALGDEKPEIGHGVICIPDFAGYTGLMSTLEVVHAHQILTCLMKTSMLEGWESLQVSKLVGGGQTDTPTTYMRGGRMLFLGRPSAPLPPRAGIAAVVSRWPRPSHAIGNEREAQYE